MRHPQVPLRRVVKLVNGGTPTPDAENWGGAIAWATPVDLAKVDGGLVAETERSLSQSGLASGSATIPAGHIIMSTRAPIGYVALAATDLAFNQGCKGLVVGHAADPRFLKYQLLAGREQLQQLGSGSTFLELAGESLLAWNVSFPPLQEQRRIADFLDDQVARIDAATSARRAQMALLMQARNADLAGVMARLRDTVKSHRLRYLASEIDERAGTATADELLSVSIHHGVVPRSELTEDLPRAADLGHYKLVLAGDIVLNRMRAFQGAVGVAGQQGVVSPDYCVLRCRPTLLPDFAHFLFRSDWFVGEMVSRLRGIGSTEVGVVRTPRVNVEDLLDISVPCPSLDQQQNVMRALKLGHSADQDRIASLQRSIDLLTEYKRSLITAAVTGEFDVSTASGRGIPA